MITKETKAAIVVLDMPLLDTRPGKDLTGILVADIVLNLMSYFAQTEREFIRQRQEEGIRAAKEKGVQFGRSPKERPEKLEKFVIDWKSGKLSARDAAKHLEISHTTFLKWAKEFGKKSTL